ncbi:hypothetical protein LY76DRAFT_606053 [Colletotrichum caudatum]|nr:hypothetical protein LY76DRAFT_606053 [Colletotrichum caudatum]
MVPSTERAGEAAARERSQSALKPAMLAPYPPAACRMPFTQLLTRILSPEQGYHSSPQARARETFLCASGKPCETKRRQVPSGRMDEWELISVSNLTRVDLAHDPSTAVTCRQPQGGFSGKAGDVIYVRTQPANRAIFQLASMLAEMSAFREKRKPTRPNVDWSLHQTKG